MRRTTRVLEFAPAPDEDDLGGIIIVCPPLGLLPNSGTRGGGACLGTEGRRCAMGGLSVVVGVVDVVGAVGGTGTGAESRYFATGSVKVESSVALGADVGGVGVAGAALRRCAIGSVEVMGSVVGAVDGVGAALRYFAIGSVRVTGFGIAGLESVEVDGLEVVEDDFEFAVMADFENSTLR